MKILIAASITFLLGVLGLFAVVKSAGETVTLQTSNGAPQETTLWVADEGGYAWVLGRPDARWYKRARLSPIVILTRDGEALTLRANVVNTPAARASISGAMGLKYGFAILSLYYGKDVVPIRLDPIRGGV